MEDLKDKDNKEKKGIGFWTESKATLFTVIFLILLGGAITVFDINSFFLCSGAEGFGCLPLFAFGGPPLWFLMISGPIILIFGIIMLIIWGLMKKKASRV
jgi:hypothetical protein